MLERLARAGARGIPLHQRHDFGLPTLGRITNLRVMPDPEHEGEHILVGDVFIDGAGLAPDLKGFSYSMNVRMLEATSPTNFEVFVPKPFYDDLALLKRLKGDSEDITVGAWFKKAADPGSVALITAAGVLLLTPAWEHFYKSVLWPGLRRAWTRLREVVPGVKTANFLMAVRGPSGESIPVLMVPGDNCDPAVTESAIETGIALLELWLRADFTARKARYKFVKLLYEPQRGRYEVFFAEYEDGQVVHIATEPGRGF
jgi:hypothetical protein